MGKKKKQQSLPAFEPSLEQLEEIIERIEAGEVGLEQCLTEYETGMKLIRHCRSILDTAETRIAKLTADADGSLKISEAGGGDISED